ncbi:hypothetical protein BDV96DRAFT_578384 [Lophiotrema nucula]|uniref:Rhodopsin domain-containing protein n=1 Tax=Lophiotrema nucula TaxID=690887 RepID=A0A6A5Z326_9PLEO|nr:hypothetical protein BDV96DRAFT_578384 [Lophiotrema nucula]
MSQWTGLGAMPPPPGVEPNFEDPDNRMRENITLHAIFLTLTTCCVLMRIYTRHFVIRKLGWDDFLVCISWCLTVVFSGLLLKSYTWGIGRHIWETPAPWLPNALKWFMIGAWMYTPLITACKLAVLSIYWRIFNNRKSARWIIGITAAVVICANTGVLFAAIFVCKPIQRSWDQTISGKCGNSTPSAYTSGAFNVLEDLVMLLIPLPFLSDLNMRTGRKLRLMAVFGLGVFVLVASIVRLVKTKVIATGLDLTRNMSNMAIWAIIEVNVSIICTCLMVLPAFFDHYWPRNRPTYGSGISSSGRKSGFIKTSSGTDPNPMWDLDNAGHSSETKLTELKGYNDSGAGNITVTHDLEVNIHSQR